MTAIVVLLLLALVFVYINGFHDTANSIATVVATRALSPRQAIVLATVTNLAGALVGTAVAATIVHDLVDPRVITLHTIIAALIGAIVWNLATWWWGIPTSSSHALVGGLCGAALAAAHTNWSEIIWAAPAGNYWWQGDGIFHKIAVPMVASPLLGFAGSYLVIGILFLVLRNWPVVRVDRVFGRLQILSGGYIGFAHGNNDAQKTIAVVILALTAATKAGTFDHLPGWLSFLRYAEPPPGDEVPVATWLKIACAVALAAGTAAGGWRIIQTMGRKITSLKPIHGFAAETTAATVLTVAAFLGFPVSTTHTITAAVAGVGASRRFASLRASVVRRIVWAWVVTLPASALTAYLVMQLFRLFGFK
jgi:inorganic phosphate transporter, PiT family